VKRLAILLPLLAACLDFDKALTDKLNALDGGTDSGMPDASSPDSGVPDAGCPGICLVSFITVPAGLDQATKGTAVTAGPGNTFYATYATDSFDDFGNLLDTNGGLIYPIDAGVYRHFDLPPLLPDDAGTTVSDMIQWPQSLELRGNLLQVTDSYLYVGLFDVEQQTWLATHSACGFGGTPTWSGGAFTDDNTVLFVGGDTNGTGAHVCTWTRSGGFHPTNLHQLADAGPDKPLWSVVALPDAGVFFGGESAAWVWRPPDPTPVVWTTPAMTVFTSGDGTSLDDVWMVGTLNGNGSGTQDIIHYDPVNATFIETPSPKPGALVNANLNDIIFFGTLVTGPNDIWTVAGVGNVLHQTGDAGWVHVDLDGIDSSSFIRGIAAHGPHDLALAVEEDFDDAGYEARLLIYTR
jgi:hypothetical protein